MKIIRKKKHIIDISESGALSDLAFILIIFFIVIAVFNVHKGFLIDLPKKGSKKYVHIDELIKVYINQNNLVIYKNKKIEQEKLEEIVNATLKVYPNMTFLLRIHPKAKYQSVVSVVDKIRKLKVENFSFKMARK